MTQEPVSAVECAEKILMFVEHGELAVRTLQAQCRLLQELPAVAREEPEDLAQRVDDLTAAIAGTGAHLRTLDDVVSNVKQYARDIVEAGDLLEDEAPETFYTICVDTKSGRRFDCAGSGTEHSTLEEAVAELHQVRRKEPRAYVARTLYHRCEEPKVEAKASKPKRLVA